ncbi:MAG: DEAD/DEAH box helicase family protein [Flavobacteriales bacterium]|nr:DEAD/DEAH box helicase family protein [Flavobacteriales bacterium]
MTIEPLELLEIKEGKKLYDYQVDAIDKIFERIRKTPERYNLCFQLPTGGGKTVIFSEIARRYIAKTGKKALILTHRIELLGQTSRMLTEVGVKNKIIVSKVKDLPDQEKYMCFVAMVETLNNRLREDKFELAGIGLVIVDEAHYNSFRKLFKWFEANIILGVTATPLSSNVRLPLHENYQDLIIGESISSLIEKGFLSKATTYSYDVSLHSLKVGINGDYTVSSSEKLYGNFFMQEKLLYAYEQVAKGTKTLIFNNGINTSKQVYSLFETAGYEVRHLDNTHTEQERRDILDWFSKKKGAILTSVSILTTGFDEPTVETVILNRATKSLTLYHQMIGRGSRVIPGKNTFKVLDIGNNARRFGLWETHIDWKDIFRHPNSYIETIMSDEQLEREMKYEMSPDVRIRFSKSKSVFFDVSDEYTRIMRSGGKTKDVLDESQKQHLRIISENSKDVYEAMDLMKLLEPDIKSRIKHYSYCIAKSTDSYLTWMREDYTRKLRQMLRTHYT